MDLLQAAIVGAPGTPYHDGLFFFDIFLPPEYPQEPPVSSLNTILQLSKLRCYVQVHYKTDYQINAT